MADQPQQDNPQRGFDVDRFIPPPPEDLLCPICHGVLNNPKQLSGCQHLFCSACINNSISTTHVEQLKCPVCRTPFRDLIQPHIVITGILNRLKLQCSFVNNGCNEIPIVEAVAQHEAECGFAPVRCPNQGCSAVGLLQNTLNEHTQQCNWRVVECPKECNAPGIRARDLGTHLSNDCINVVMECSLGCGATQLQRKDLRSHIDNVCPKRLVGCVVNGCKFHGEDGRADVWRQHMADDGRLHMELVLNEISRLRGEILELRSENEAIKTENMELKTGLQRVEMAQHKLGQDIARVEQLNSSTNQVVKRMQTSVTRLNTPADDELRARIKALELSKDADLVVCNAANKWDSGIHEYSEERTFQHQDSQLRYPYMLHVHTTTVDDEKYLQVDFIPRRGKRSQTPKWPITNHIRISVINTKGRSDKTFILQGEEIRHVFAQNSPPPQYNMDGEGWRLLDKAEIDSGDFVDAKGNMFFKAEILPQVFITQPARDLLVGIANAKGCDWVVERVRARWEEGMTECSPQLTITHSNPALQYSYLLCVDINLTHDNEGYVGVYLIPRAGAQRTHWPIRNHIRLTILSLSHSYTHQVSILDGPGDKEDFINLGTPTQHNFAGWGWPRLLSKEEVFGTGYVDANDRMFIKVEVMDSTFD